MSSARASGQTTKTAYLKPFFVAWRRGDVLGPAGAGENQLKKSAEGSEFVSAIRVQITAYSHQTR